MFAFLLQDWLTLQGPSLASSSPITQSELAWLDMSAFLDLVTWLEVSDISAGTYHCAFQTSPTKDEALFTAMNDVTATGTPMAQGVQVGVYLRDTALCPLSHWLRWQIIPPASTAWNMTFRIWVSANQPGGIADELTPGAASDYGAGPAWTPSVGGIGGGGPAPSPSHDYTHQQFSKQMLPTPIDKTRMGPSYAGNPFNKDYITHATGAHFVRPSGRRPTLVSRGPRPEVTAVNPFLPPGSKVKR